MPDLGELEIVERPLVIHEAKAGGRKLTKNLFRQLPDWTEVHASPILSDCSADIVAWVSYHWEECDTSRYLDDVSGEHIHIILSENTKPYRGTVWAGPYQRNGSDPIAIDRRDGHVGAAIVAMLARKKINGGDIKGSKVYGDFLLLNRQGRRIRFTCDGEICTDLRSDIESDRGVYGNEIVQKTRERLVRVAQLQETDEALRAQIDDYITDEDSYRADVKQVWRLVTRETPQVFV